MHFKSKLWMILLTIGAVGMMLTGCAAGKSDTFEETMESEVVEDTRESLYFWYSDESMTDYINSAAVAFGEKNDVRVIPKLVGDSAYLEAINEATLHGQQMPDAYLISNDSLEKAYLAGLAVEIKDESNIMNGNTFPETALEAVTYQNKRVGYPLFFETSALLYNETYLQEWALQQAKKEAESLGVEYDEATLLTRQDEIMADIVPSTIDEVLNVANNFDAPETVEGVFKWDVSDIFYNYYIVGNYMKVGGEYGDDKTIIDINNPETIACLEVYKALNQFFYIESDTVSYESVMQDFLDGKIVFTIATTDAVATLEKAKEEGSFAYDYGVSLIPHPSDQLQGRSLSVTTAIATNGYSQKQELANQFAAFLTNEYVDEMYVRSGRVPANLKANTDNEALQIFKEEYANSISLPKMMETGNYWIQLEILFSKVWNGGDVPTLMADLAAQIESQVNAGQ